MHPDTRSHPDLNTCRLSAHTRNPARIRRQAVPEIVEQIPTRLPSAPPTVRTLTYPIAIRLTRAMEDRPSADAAAPDADLGDDGAGGDPADGEDANVEGNVSRGRRARKRRRSLRLDPGHGRGACRPLGWPGHCSHRLDCRHLRDPNG